MKNLEEKYTWEKENLDDIPPIGFFHILKGLSRLLVFLPSTIFLVLIFLILKIILKPLNLNYPVFLIRKLWSILILRLFGLKLKVIGKKNFSRSL